MDEVKKFYAFAAVGLLGMVSVFFYPAIGWAAFVIVYWILVSTNTILVAQIKLKESLQKGDVNNE